MNYIQPRGDDFYYIEVWDKKYLEILKYQIYLVKKHRSHIMLMAHKDN